ncbi:MAG TPA: hypothetical protein VM935_04765, partial [Chitinophagaceae bacterium]|nr:hypothetical protein [Chitinophagaceae bacterium]
MKQLFFLFLIAGNICACAQERTGFINEKEVERIERVLASDELLGRRPGTPGIEKAATFISEEFKKAGLKPLHGLDSFVQKFKLLDPKFISVSGEMDGTALDPKNIIAITTREDLKIDDKSGYEFKTILPDSNLMREAYKLISARKNYIVFVNESYAKDFNRISRFKQPGFESPHSIVFVLSNKSQPKKYTVQAKHTMNAVPMS